MDEMFITPAGGVPERKKKSHETLNFPSKRHCHGRCYACLNIYLMTKGIIDDLLGSLLFKYQEKEN